MVETNEAVLSAGKSKLSETLIRMPPAPSMYLGPTHCYVSISHSGHCALLSVRETLKEVKPSPPKKICR